MKKSSRKRKWTRPPRREESRPLQQRTSDQVLRSQETMRQRIEKGQKSEQLFYEALRLMVQNGEIYCFYHTQSKDELDRQGIDFLVYTAPSRAIPFQVKSSEKGRKDHYTEHGPRIRCIVVDPFITTENLAQRIKDEIEQVIIEELADAYHRSSPDLAI